MPVENITIQEIEAYIDRAFHEWGIPGGAVSIFMAGEILSSKGYGVKELGVKGAVDENTVFAIGSCTEAFTATAVGILVDEGKVSWDDPIRKYLPDFELYDPWISKEVTARDMICHRTGIISTQRLMQRDEVFDPEDTIRRMKYMRPFAPFRTKFGYTNPEYMVAGKVIEVVSGQSWEDFLEGRIFKPLGMLSTSPTYTRMMGKGLDNIAAPHCNLDGGLVPMDIRMFDPVESIPWSDYGKNAAGTITSNLKDTNAWLEFLLGKGNFRGEQIISQDTFNEIIRPQIIIAPEDSEFAPIFAVGVESNFTTYGLGWFVFDYKGRLLILHGGQINGFNAAIAFVPEIELGIAVYVNVHHTLVHPMLGFYILDRMLGEKRDYCGEMKELVTQWRHAADLGVAQITNARKKGAKPALAMQNLAGTYRSDLYGDIEIKCEHGKLVHYYGSSQYFIGDLEHWEENTFVVHYRFAISDPEFITFILNEKQNVVSIAVTNQYTFVDSFNRIA